MRKDFWVKFALGLLLAISALGLRWVERYNTPVLSRDSIQYILLAEQSFSASSPTNQSIQYLPPLFTALQIQLMHLGCNAENAGMAINLVLGSLIPVIVFLLALALVKRISWAFFAGLLAAAHPSLVELSTVVQRDTPYLFLSGLSIWCFLQAIFSENRFWWIFCGVFQATAIMVRHESFELMIMTSVFFVYIYFLIRQKKIEFTSPGAKFCSYISGLVLTLIFWLWLLPDTFEYLSATYYYAIDLLQK